MSSCKGRFAPSPSGRMHLGNVFTAVMSWLYARSEDGEFVLRIEDLDPDRCRPEYAEQLRNDLRWLGLDWDYESVPQSRRTPAYEAAFEKISRQGLVYPCYCSRADLHAASAPHAADGELIYPGTCRGLTAVPDEKRNKKPCCRIIVPDRSFSFADGIQGSYTSNLAADCGDFILRRADGVFAYQLAVVTDDAESAINQVVRGSDLLSSVPRQLYLYELLGCKPPEWYHLPLLCAPDGRRLSKREADLNVAELRKNFRPEEILAMVYALVMNGEREKSLSLQEFLAAFSPENVKKVKTLTLEPGFFEKF